MGKDTCIISGDSLTKLCARVSSMLIMRVYETPRDKLPDPLKPWHDANMEHWDMAWEVKQTKNSDGFQCALYTPKNAGGTKAPQCCPPVLAFRGSDSEPEDFAKLALNIKGRFTLTGRNTPAQPGSAIPPVSLPFDTSLSPSPDYNGKPERELSGLSDSTPLFSNVTVSRSLSFTWTPPLMQAPIDTKLTLTIVFTATLYCGDKGDWPTNFAQGLGHLPKQYQQAIDNGIKAAKEATSNWNNRLSIVGHSLGGGLASAAALAAQKAYPELKISCWTYNAAGLSKETAKAADDSSLTDACSIPIRSRYVQSEILSSLQSRTPLVPFMSSLLRWSGHQMPEAVAMPFGYEGVSPGTYNLGGQSLEYAPMWGALPKLFPLEAQELIPGAQFRYVKPVLDLAEHSRDIDTFLKGVLDLLAKSVKGASLEDMEGIGGLLLGYLLPTTRKALMKDAMNKPDPDIDMAGHRRHVPYDRDASRPAWLLDWLELSRLLVASGCYHLWPTCAFTFLLDKPKQ